MGAGAATRLRALWLPHELLWRDKAEFGDGSGAADVLTEAIEAESASTWRA